jgi:hypothetical protein
MPTMLEQAVIDADALKEAAIKNAESTIVQKYSSEVKEAIERLLEQPMPPEEEMMGPPPMAGPMNAVGPPGGGLVTPPEMQTDFQKQVSPTYAEDDTLCPCPGTGDTITINFDQLATQVAEKEGEIGQPGDMVNREATAEEFAEEQKMQLQELDLLDIINEHDESYEHTHAPLEEATPSLSPTHDDEELQEMNYWERDDKTIQEEYNNKIDYLINENSQLKQTLHQYAHVYKSLEQSLVQQAQQNKQLNENIYKNKI